MLNFSIRYTNEFFCYNLTWSGMTTRAQWLILEGCGCVTDVTKFVYLLFLMAFSLLVLLLHFSKSQINKSMVKCEVNTEYLTRVMSKPTPK